MELLTKQLYKTLLSWGIPHTESLYIEIALSIALLFILAFIIGKFSYKIAVKGLRWLSKSSETDFDDFLLETKFTRYIAYIPAYVLVVNGLKVILKDYPATSILFIKLTNVYLLLLIVWILRSIIRAIKAFLKSKNSYKDKPIDSFYQVFMMIVWGLGLLAMLSSLTDKSIVAFLTTLGAASAVLLFIFKDTILGFIASIQMSVNDIVRINDWITQESYGADGVVLEINLTTVKVKNFDNTITTIPTYSLISDSFRNWRGMEESNGRRIKRCLYLKQSSVKFLDKQDLSRLSKIQYLKEYIEKQQNEINDHNSKFSYNNRGNAVNGRNLTNLGVFRKYCDIYLKNHPRLNKQLTLMTRHLKPTDKGIPLEVYVFSKEKNWVKYERIQADIFEHLIASISYFDLEIFEYTGGLYEK